jgi:hypothetical protein
MTGSLEPKSGWSRVRPDWVVCASLQSLGRSSVNVPDGQLADAAVFGELILFKRFLVNQLNTFYRWLG